MTSVSLLFRIRRFFIGIKAKWRLLPSTPSSSHSSVCKDCKLERAPYDSEAGPGPTSFNRFLLLASAAPCVQRAGVVQVCQVQVVS